MKKTSEVLTSALALIDTPEKWFGGGGEWIGTGKKCADLALSACARQEQYDEFIHDWNDAPGRTHADVVAAFRRAIAAEQAKEAAQ